jgi:hypothetical protein
MRDAPFALAVFVRKLSLRATVEAAIKVRLGSVGRAAIADQPVVQASACRENITAFA